MRSLKQKKTYHSMKKEMQAHKKAPLDYISPWDEHLHMSMNMNVNTNGNASGNGSPNGHAYQAGNGSGNANMDNKVKIDNGKQNIVQSFLSKIRKSHKNYLKNRFIHKNQTMSQGESRVWIQGEGNGKKMKETMGRSYTDGNNNSNIDGEKGQDLGFGLVNYTKNDAQIQQNKSKTQTIFQNKKLQSNPNSSSKHFPQKSLTAFSKNPSNALFLFTQQQKQKAHEIVFIKKKKNNNKATVINLNDTTQEFYQEQIRYTENQMMRKYRKLAARGGWGKGGKVGERERERGGTRTGLKNYRCVTEQGMRGQACNNTTMYKEQNGKNGGMTNLGNCRVRQRQSYSQDPIQALLDKQYLKKRYSFLEQVKDQSIPNKVHHLMRCHPSLANSILIQK